MNSMTNSMGMYKSKIRLRGTPVAMKSQRSSSCRYGLSLDADLFLKENLI